MIKKVLAAVLAVSAACVFGSVTAAARDVYTGTMPPAFYETAEPAEIVTNKKDDPAYVDSTPIEPFEDDAPVHVDIPKKVGTEKNPSGKKALFIKYKISDGGTLTISDAPRNYDSVYKQSTDWFANYGLVLGSENIYSGERELLRYKTPWDSKAKKIRKVVIEEDVSGIPPLVFADLPNLKEAEIKTDASLPADTFTNCPKLTKVSLPVSTDGVSSQAAVNCPKLKPTVLGITYTYDKTAKILKVFPKKDAGGQVLSGTWYAFGSPWKSVGKDVKRIELAEGLRSIPGGAFKGMKSLTTAVLPASLKTIGSNAFAADKKLKNAALPKNLTSIEHNAFSGTALTSVHLKKPASGTLNVDNSAFSDCPNVKTVTVDKGVTINSDTFRNNTKLTDLTLASGAVMNDNAFPGCDALKNVTSDYIFATSDYYAGDLVQMSLYTNGWGTYDKTSKDIYEINDLEWGGYAFDTNKNTQIPLFTKSPGDRTSDNTKTLKILGNKAVKWNSTNKTVATVDSKGKVKGRKEGFAVVYARAADGSQVNFLIAVYGELSRRIMDMQSQLPAGYYWNTYPPAKGYTEVSSQPCIDHPTDSHGRGQCVGYGLTLARRVFGYGTRYTLNANTVKAGAYVAMTRGWSWRHVVFVTQVIKKGQVIGYDFAEKKAVKAKSKLYVCTDCNWASDCGIRWGFVKDRFDDLNLAQSFNSY